MTWRLPPDQSAMGGVYGAQDAPLWLQSGMQESPQIQPGAHLRNGMPMPRRVGIGESIANALLPRRDEQGVPQAPGVGDFVSAALMALPGARGARSPKAAAAPERVDWAAIKVGDKIFKGQNHFGAGEAAAKELGIPFDKVADMAQDGFLTTTGRFVDRAEAGRIVDAIGQSNTHSVLRAPELHASEVKFPRNDLQQFLYDLKQ